MSEEQGNNNHLQQSLQESEAKLAALRGEEPEEQVSERPEWLPEKFQSAEEMAKAYQELEGKLGEDTKEETEEPTQADFGEFTKYKEEFWETGELSEASIKELVETKGIPKSIIDDYVQLGRQHQEFARLQQEDKVLEDFGGRAKFQEMASWARDNLSDDEIEGLNASLGSGNEKAIKFALSTLKGKYEGASKPKLFKGQTKPDSSGVFKSHAEVKEAMAKLDSRGRNMYQTSEAYRNKVIEKLKRSKL